MHSLQNLCVMDFLFVCFVLGFFSLGFDVVSLSHPSQIYLPSILRGFRLRKTGEEEGNSSLVAELGGRRLGMNAS